MKRQHIPKWKTVLYAALYGASLPTMSRMCSKL